MNIKNLIIISTAIILILGAVSFFVIQTENKKQSQATLVADDGIGIESASDVPEEAESIPALPKDIKDLYIYEEKPENVEMVKKGINVSEWQTYINKNYNIKLRFPDWWTVEIQEEVSGGIKNLQSIIWLSDKKDPYEGITIMVVKDSLENTLNDNKKRKDIIPFFAKEYYLNINNIPSIGFRGDDMYSGEYKKVYILGGENFSYIIMTNSEDIRIFEEVLHSFNAAK